MVGEFLIQPHLLEQTGSANAVPCETCAENIQDLCYRVDELWEEVEGVEEDCPSVPYVGNYDHVYFVNRFLVI